MADEAHAGRDLLALRRASMSFRAHHLAITVVETDRSVLLHQPDRSTRCANTAAGNNPADGTRFGSSKLTDTRLKS
jgi:hypothetical protein